MKRVGCRARSDAMRVVAFAICVAIISSVASSTGLSTGQNAPPPKLSFKQMPDGRRWTTENMNVKTDQSYCYDDAEANCARYGRLYTWQAAHEGCRALGEGWRLPSESEWRQLVKHFGGIIEDAGDNGKASYLALSRGGRSGFSALLGGSRAASDGRYERLEAHGFYWTSSDSSTTTAWFYNFGRGGSAVNRHREGGKQMAISVRCVSD